VLAALWRRGPLSPRDLIAEVQGSNNWGEATVKTLLGRLMRKGAIRSERADARLQYRAVLERSAYVEGEVDVLLERLFQGRAEDLINLLSRRVEARRP
jgi:predicted transcriptional regulator